MPKTSKTLDTIIKAVFEKESRTSKKNTIAAEGMPRDSSLSTLSADDLSDIWPRIVLACPAAIFRMDIPINAPNSANKATQPIVHNRSAIDKPDMKST